MNDVDLFEGAKISSWYDIRGLLKAWKPLQEGVRRKRKLAYAASIAAAASLMVASVAAHATAEPAQGAIAWPVAQTPESTRESLALSLKQIRELKANWNARLAPKPIERSISVAEYILPQLPDVVADARAGVDDNGNVFLRIHCGDRVAFITVEPKAMHLLFVETGQPNVYVDEEAFGGKIIPSSIKKVLDERLKS